MRRALGIALALNIGMFLIEFSAALLAHSTALLADSADFLADSIVYGVAWWAMESAKHSISRLIGWAHVVFALGVFAAAAYRGISGVLPVAEAIGAVGLLALSANLGSAWVLHRHRHTDTTLRAVWIASRNDAINNGVVIVAGLLVYFTGAPWPDLLVAIIIGSVELQGGWSILRKKQQ